MKLMNNVIVSAQLSIILFSIWKFRFRPSNGWWLIVYPLYYEPRGRSYKHSTIVNYDSSLHCPVWKNSQYFLKNGPFPASFYLRLFNTVDSKQMFHIKVCLLMNGFEPRTSGVGSACSFNWVTTTANSPIVWDWLCSLQA